MGLREAAAAVAAPTLLALAAAFVPASAAASSSDLDVDGDGAADVVAADPRGRLWLYRTDGAGGWRLRHDLGWGWRDYDEIHIAGDWDGDDVVDVVARSRTTGQLVLHAGDGEGELLPPRSIGRGWQGFSDLVFPGDWSGDGHPDALAVRRVDGVLLLYPGDGQGGWQSPRRIGVGWQNVDLLTAVGDWDGDDDGDLLARDPSTGELRLYRGDGHGGFDGSEVVGTGWMETTALVRPGDFDGDGANDVLRRDLEGRLVLYRGDGSGGFRPRPYRVVGRGWEDLRLNEPTQVPRTVIRYSVETLGPVESDAGAFARHVEWTLNDPRGWSLQHRIRFDEVQSGADVRLHLANTDDVAALPGCSETSVCVDGDDVYIADEVWRTAPETYADRRLDEYRQYLVNHAVGRWLGLDVAECPGVRRPAPVMQRQYESLDLCRPNVWPDREEALPIHPLTY